jgi:UDP-4-amino-4-deoxy-L-arabinose-oxoglutarate aminotransferase
MCDMKAIKAIADQYGIFIVEDCAHSVESERDGIKPGQLADISCFSFYATKNLTSGEGGAIVTQSQELADKVRVLRLHGMSKSAVDRHVGPYQHWDMLELGWKYNMANIQAALLLPQMKKIDAKWQARHKLYNYYMKSFLEVPTVKFPGIKAGSKSAYHLFTIWVDETQRDALLAFLGEKQIGCAVNYRAIHLLSYYSKTLGLKQGSYPVAEAIGNQTISLPFWPGLDEQCVDYVIDQIRQFFKK